MDPPMFEAPEGGHRYKGIKRTGMRYRDVDYTIVQERQLWKWGFAVYNKSHTGEAATTRALQAYLGHCNIQHTVRYTELSPGRFKDFWR
jgi:hypothetical protein